MKLVSRRRVFALLVVSGALASVVACGDDKAKPAPATQPPVADQPPATTLVETPLVDELFTNPTPDLIALMEKDHTPSEEEIRTTALFWSGLQVINKTGRIPDAFLEFNLMGRVQAIAEKYPTFFNRDGSPVLHTETRTGGTDCPSTCTPPAATASTLANILLSCGPRESKATQSVRELVDLATAKTQGELGVSFFNAFEKNLALLRGGTLGQVVDADQDFREAVGITKKANLEPISLEDAVNLCEAVTGATVALIAVAAVVFTASTAASVAVILGGGLIGAKCGTNLFFASKDYQSCLEKRVACTLDGGPDAGTDAQADASDGGDASDSGVRCGFANRYIVLSSVDFFDTKKGLTWHQKAYDLTGFPDCDYGLDNAIQCCGPRAFCNWKGAGQWCATLGMRLPTEDEIRDFSINAVGTGLCNGGFDGTLTSEAPDGGHVCRFYPDSYGGYCTPSESPYDLDGGDGFCVK